MRRREFLVATAAAGAAGAVFVVATQRLLGGLGVPPSAVDAFGAALAWAGVLAVVTVAGARLVRADAADGRAVRALVAAHAAFGVALALWVRLTWAT